VGVAFHSFLSLYISIFCSKMKIIVRLAGHYDINLYRPFSWISCVHSDSQYWNMSCSCIVVSCSNNNGLELREVHCSLNSQSQGAKCFYVSKNSQKSSSSCSLGAAIDLEGPVEAGGDQELGVPSESHSCGEGCVLTQNLEFVPLLAKVDAHI